MSMGRLPILMGIPPILRGRPPILMGRSLVPLAEPPAKTGLLPIESKLGRPPAKLETRPQESPKRHELARLPQ